MMKRILKASIVIAVLLIAGVIVTKLTVSSNLENYTGIERYAGEFALNEASHLTGEVPSSHPFVIAMQIKSIENVKQYNQPIPQEKNAFVEGFRTRIQLYTLFRIPYGVVYIDDDGFGYE